MILNGLEYKECPVCKRLCLKPEITFYENRCRCFTGDKNDDCYWRLKGEQQDVESL